MFEVEKIAQQIRKETLPISLKDCSFSSSLRLLVLAPHPDDFDAIAVTLKYFQKNGNQILLFVLTGASSGVNDSYLSQPTKERKEKVRENEQKKALEFFGFPISDVKFLYLPEDKNGNMILDNECRLSVGQFFQKFAPDMLMLPHGEDTNQSHQRTYSLARDLAKTISKPVLALYNQDPKTIQIRLDAYMEFDETISLWKREMLRFHQSQHVRNLQTRGFGFDDRILNMNAEIADQIDADCKYAEGFQMELFEKEILS
jgi:LmbE family N-acetylglucosaminyl deacetylase